MFVMSPQIVLEEWHSLMRTVGRYAFHSVTNLDFETYCQQLQKTASWCANQRQAWSRDLKKCGSDICRICSKVNSQYQIKQMCTA